MKKKESLSIQNKMKVFRAEFDLTQEGLANEVGVTRATINAIEKGKYTPSLELAFKIALFFKVDIEKVFFVTEVEKKLNEKLKELKDVN